MQRTSKEPWTRIWICWNRNERSRETKAEVCW